jgi:hypothetical protein
MDRSALAEEVDRKYPFLLVLWGALLASVGFYGVVGWFAGRQVEPLAPETENLLVPVLALLAVGEGAVSILISRKILAFHERDPEWNLDRDEGPSHAEETPGSQPAQEFPNTWGRLQSSLLLSYGLADAVGIYGLLLHLLTGRVLYLGIFLAAAALLLLSLYPSRERVRRGVEGLMKV